MRLNATTIGIYYLAFFAANYIVGTAVVGLIAFLLSKLFLAKPLMGTDAATA